jgi:hypothetical protein
MGLASVIQNSAKSALAIVKYLPAFFGVASVLVVQAPTGRTLVQDIRAMNVDNFLYDAKEIFTGVDANGNIQKPWLAKTYLPVFIGGLVSTAIGWLQNYI